MAKRHHASEKKHDMHHHKDPRPHSRGSHMDHDGQYEGHYEGHAGRRHQEMRDAGMISEDHNAIANLPQNVMIKPYPMEGNYMPEDLDDTIRGVDRQESADDRKRSSERARSKY